MSATYRGFSLPQKGSHPITKQTAFDYYFCPLFWMYFFFGNHPKKKYQKERSPLLMHLLNSTASSIRAGRAAQLHVQGSFQYACGCARGLLAEAPAIEDALILNADPSNAEVKCFPDGTPIYKIRF